MTLFFTGSNSLLASTALASAVRRVLADPGLAARLSRPHAPALHWPAVAARYEALAAGLIAATRRPATTTTTTRDPVERHARS